MKPVIDFCKVAAKLRRITANFNEKFTEIEIAILILTAPLFVGTGSDGIIRMTVFVFRGSQYTANSYLCFRQYVALSYMQIGCGMRSSFVSYVVTLAILSFIVDWQRRTRVARGA